MPDNQALQVFYGTVPLMVVLGAIYFNERTLLKDILARLTAMHTEISAVKGELSKLTQRLVVLETRAGIVFHDAK